MRAVMIGAIIICLLIGAQNAMAHHNSEYKKGYAEGVKDAHALIFHQDKLIHYNAPESFGRGYVDGWRATCPEMGLALGPSGPCESSMDVGTP
jgi:hypothetical protein